MPAFNSSAAFWARVARARVVAFCCDLRAVNFAGNLCRAVALLVGLTLSLGSLAANAQERNRRVALVIGNSSYETAYQIKNALNDVRDVGNLLVRAGFEVISIEDGSHEDIRRGLLKFERLLEKSRVGLFYFSGHGAQSRDGKRNLLLPVGQNYRDMSDIEVHGVDAAQVLDRMRIAGGSLNIVILDACRSERPLPDLEQKGMGSGKGLARMDTPSGSLIAFAAAPGKVALDDLRGNNSRYTKHLLQAMSTPGLGLSEVFQYVQGKVEDETLGAQSPELLNRLRDPRPFYFFEPKAEMAASHHDNALASTGQFQASAETEDGYWDRIKSGRNVLNFEEYLNRYPTGKYVAPAKRSLSALNADAQSNTERIKVSGLGEMDRATRTADSILCSVEPLTQNWQHMKYQGGCVNGVAEGEGSYTADKLQDGELLRFSVKGHFKAGRLDGTCTEYGPSGNLIFEGICRENRRYEGTYRSTGIRTKIGEFITTDRGVFLFNGIDRANDLSYGYHVIGGNIYAYCRASRINETNCTEDQRRKILGQ